MGRKNEENRKAHKKRLDQKKRAKNEAIVNRTEKLKLIQKGFSDKD